MAQVLTQTIAFRTTGGEYRRLQQLRATFPEGQWGETFRWLLAQPEVKATITARLKENVAEEARGGLDWSLPTGDR